MQVHAHDAVGAGRLEQVGHEARGDRLATTALLVLAGIRVEGGDDGDALRGGALEGVHHDELLHEPLVDRVGVGLDDEGIGSPHALVVPRIDLAVGEGAGIGVDEVRAERLGDVDRELRMRASRHDNESLLTGGCDLGHVPCSLLH
jgi:hypothetical protein